MRSIRATLRVFRHYNELRHSYIIVIKVNKQIFKLQVMVRTYNGQILKHGKMR